jgi:predicted glycoside hydrolase/deacetylase ChbG (UPF0249 family)
MAETRRRRRLIVNADDLGISVGVNAGIIEGVAFGTVTAASMVVNLDAFEDAVSRARSYPGLSLGLHVNLTMGRPLTSVASLTDSRGNFFSLPALLWRASAGLVDGAEVTEECAAQFDRLKTRGVEVTHVDSHRHVHAHPALFASVLEAVRSRGGAVVRMPVEPVRMNFTNPGATLKKLGLGIATAVSARRHRVKSSINFFGISLQGGNDFAAKLFRLIPKLPAGTTELMVHPGRIDPALGSFDGYTWQREKELDALLAPGFKELLQQHSIELARFE